jgi:Ca2+:H+ antiporter
MAMLKSLLRKEWSLLLSYGSLVAVLLLGDSLRADCDHPMEVGLYFSWLFIVILITAFNVVRHAEALAELLGEPYGTLILTLSVIGLEVMMIATVMVTGDDVPTIARDTMFGVLMIVMNGLFGLAIFAGAWKHRQQGFNVQSSTSYIGMLILLIGIGLFLPHFMAEGAEHAFHIMLIVVGAVLYGIFLWVQIFEHRGFFEYHDAEGELVANPHGHAERGVVYHSVVLVLTLIPVVVLAKTLAVVMDTGLVILSAPPQLVGLVVAILILAPEGVAAVRAGMNNNLQRSVNICLGSGLATIGLTIPVVLIISLITGESIVLGLEPVEMVLIAISLLLLKTNLESGRTNILMGAIFMALFAAYIALIFI